MHNFSGFTTGEWSGDVLTAKTTHLKETINRRNGVPSSDQASMTTHLMRHGNLLTVVMTMHDPVYLTEPHMLSRTFALDPRGLVGPVSTACFPFVELPELDGSSVVPSLLPGKNPDMNSAAKFYSLPQDAILGIAETLYPEYRKKIEGKYMRPEQCVRYCCGWVSNGPPESAPGLSCITNGSGQIGR